MELLEGYLCCLQDDVSDRGHRSLSSVFGPVDIWMTCRRGGHSNQIIRTEVGRTCWLKELVFEKNLSDWNGGNY